MVKNKKEAELKGIGGWLIFPIIGLFVKIFIMLDDISWTTANYYMNSFIAFLICIDVIMIIISIICLFLIFNKSKHTKKMMIVFYIANGMIGLYVLEILTIIGSCIWIAYFIKSERVKNTFVN